MFRLLLPLLDVNVPETGTIAARHVRNSDCVVFAGLSSLGSLNCRIGAAPQPRSHTPVNVMAWPPVLWPPVVLV